MKNELESLCDEIGDGYEQMRAGVIEWLGGVIPPTDMTWANPTSREQLIARMTFVTARASAIKLAGQLDDQQHVDLLGYMLWSYLEQQAESRARQINSN